MDTDETLLNSFINLDELKTFEYSNSQIAKLISPIFNKWRMNTFFNTICDNSYIQSIDPINVNDNDSQNFKLVNPFFGAKSYYNSYYNYNNYCNPENAILDPADNTWNNISAGLTAQDVNFSVTTTIQNKIPARSIIEYTLDDEFQLFQEQVIVIGRELPNNSIFQIKIKRNDCIIFYKEDQIGRAHV